MRCLILEYQKIIFVMNGNILVMIIFIRVFFGGGGKIFRRFRG